jgi:hypothetical protein
VIHVDLRWLSEDTVSSHPAEIHKIANELNEAYTFHLYWYYQVSGD